MGVDFRYHVGERVTRHGSNHIDSNLISHIFFRFQLGKADIYARTLK